MAPVAKPAITLAKFLAGTGQNRAFLELEAREIGRKEHSYDRIAEHVLRPNQGEKLNRSSAKNTRGPCEQAFPVSA